MPDPIDVELVGLGALRSSLDDAAARAPAAVDKAADAVAETWLRDARGRVPRRSGAARASLKLIGATGTRQLVGGGRTAPYLPWLDFGGRAGTRGARRPVIRGGRYIFPALAGLDGKITQELDRAAGKIVDEV